jgi:hypothetical protein
MVFGQNVLNFVIRNMQGHDPRESGCEVHSSILRITN